MERQGGMGRANGRETEGAHGVGAKGCRVQGQAKWGREGNDGRMDVGRG